MVDFVLINCDLIVFYSYMSIEVRKIDKGLFKYIVPPGPFSFGNTERWLLNAHNDLTYIVSLSSECLADYHIPGACRVHIEYEEAKRKGYCRIEKA